MSSLSDKSLKVITYTLLIIMTLVPLYIYYKYEGAIVQYLYLFGVPSLMIISELKRIKKFNQIKLIDFIAYSIVSTTLILSYFNITFVEIFVWQITLGSIGILIEVISDNELKQKNFVKSWSRIIFLGVFLYFIVTKFKFLN